jgi:hypothetical protein
VTPSKGSPQKPSKKESYNPSPANESQTIILPSMDKTKLLSTNHNNSQQRKAIKRVLKQTGEIRVVLLNKRKQKLQE